MKENIELIMIFIVVGFLAGILALEIRYLCRSIVDRLAESKTKDRAICDHMRFNEIHTKVAYTRDILNFVREFTADNSVLKYESYVSNIHMEKLNKRNLENFISETATDIRDSLSEHSIMYDMLLVTRDYIDSLIIDTCIYNIRLLFEKTVDENADDDTIEI